MISMFKDPCVAIFCALMLVVYMKVVAVENVGKLGIIAGILFPNHTFGKLGKIN